MSKEAQKQQHSTTYRTPKEFLEYTTVKVQTQKSIYELVDSHMFPTINIEDEYVVIVLEIKEQELREFYGGKYLIQQWSMKHKLFQTVHNSKPLNFYLYRQRFAYSLQGYTEECQWIYIISFFQEILNKIKNPLYDKDNFEGRYISILKYPEIGKHELDLYVDGKQIFVINSARIMWAPLNFENDEKQSKQMDNKMSLNYSELDISLDMPQLEEKLSMRNVQKPAVEPIVIDVQFKSVLANVDGDAPEFLQIFDIGTEGYAAKDIHVLVEMATKVAVYQIVPTKLRNVAVFKFSPTNIKFDKTEMGYGFQEPIQSAKIINISDNENIYLLTKPSGELKLVSEKDIYKEGNYLSQSLIPGLARLGALTKQVIPDQEEESDSEEEEASTLFGGKEDELFVKSMFLRRNYIYFEELDGTIQRLNVSDCKLNHPLKRIQQQDISLSEAQLQDVSIHLQVFNDYILANTALLITHAKILSIFDFKTQQWNHILPSEQGVETATAASKEIYFGMPDDEIQTIMLNHIFPSMVYDCFMQYKSSHIRRLKYYNEINKCCFEKRLLFKDYLVHQIVKNNDMQSYRSSGFSVNRTFFLVYDFALEEFQIWVCENGMKITKLIQGIEEKWQILNVKTAPSDILAIYSQASKKLTFYSIEHMQQCINPEEMVKYIKLELPNFKPLDSNDTKYFYFDQKLFYNQGGNLICINLTAKNQQGLIQEYNFKSSIKDMQMIDVESVYYKDKKNMFRYANLGIQNTFNIEQLPTKVIYCCGAFVQKMDYCLMTNRLALFTSPFEISIIPNLNKPAIDLMATMDFEDNFVFWRQTEDHLFAFKEPNMIVDWSLDAGKVLGSTKQPNVFLRNFKKHSEWNGTTLLKQSRDKVQDKESIEEEIMRLKELKIFDVEELEEEQRQRIAHPYKHLFTLVKIDDEGQINQMCRFLYDYRQGSTLYASYPYLLLMDEKSTKLYNFTGEGIFKELKFMNNFFEPQMKVGKPLYFSPDFHHRLFVDNDTNELILNYTLTNANLVTLKDLRKNLVYQVEDTHPMIYFHDNEHVVYLTNQGIEKVCQIKKKQKRKKTTTKIKEVANCFYHQKAFARRFFYDLQNFNEQQCSNINDTLLLQIRGDIIRRNLLLNEYLISKSEDSEHTNLKKEYKDKNLGAFNSFIIGNYRKQLTFSYLSWKIIEEIANRRCSMLDFKNDFMMELCHTILPNQETILHELTNNFEEFLNFVRILDPKQDKKDKQEKLTMTDIPFLPNLQGITPLHISIARNNTRFTDKIMYLLAGTEFDHHARFIMSELHKMVDQVPQALGYYLEHRAKITCWLQNYSRGALKTLDDNEFMMSSMDMWNSKIDKQIQKRLFDEESHELPLTMHIVDLPHMQKYDNKVAEKFIEVLSETDNISLFSSASVRAIVELKWPAVKQAMITKLFFPYCVFNLSFLIYTTFIFENLNQGGEELDASEIGWDFKNPQFWIMNQKHIFKIILLSLCLYFFSLEFRQFVVQGPGKYFGSGWNYVDIIPLSLIFFSMTFEYFFVMPQFERAMYAISSFFLWLKFLYFMRLFRAPSKFISIIVAVIADMKVFLFVFLIALVSFSQSLYILSNSNDPKHQFINSMEHSVLFTYCISLGSWEADQLGENNMMLVLTLFLLSTIFLCVIMLNMLIAVVSDTYARVESSSSQEMYKNLSDLIVENSFLVPQKQLESHDKRGDYLYIAKLDNTQVSENTIEGKVLILEDALMKRTQSIEHSSRELVKTFTNALAKVAEKHTLVYIDESMKNEIKFKQYMDKLENKPQSPSQGSPIFGRLDSNSTSQVTTPRNLVKKLSKGNKSAKAVGGRAMPPVQETQGEDGAMPFQ